MTTDHRTSTRAAERLRAGQGCEAAASWSCNAAPEHRAGRVYSCSTVGRRLTAPMAARRVGGSHRGLVVGAWVIASGLVGLLGACAPDDELPLPPVVWEGESVRVRMDDPEIEVCSGSFEALDRHAELVREALLLDGDGVVEYSIGDQDFVESACGLESVPGCTFPVTGEVFTTMPMHEHELVHAVRTLDPEITLLSSPFEEGLATMFGGDRFDDEAPLFEPSIILVEEQIQSGLDYYYAGQTMALLLARHGTNAFRRFDTRPRAMDEDEAFIAAFGESKEQFIAAVEDLPHCEQSQWWSPLLECDGEPAIPDPLTDRLVLSGNLECGESDVHGPRAERMWITRHFRLARTTFALDYHIDIPEDATLEVVACNGGCPGRFAYIGTRSQVGSILNGLPDLEPGDYFLRVSRPVTDDAGNFEVTL